MNEWGTLFGLPGLALGLGLLHALDADHILAVSTLAGREHAGNKHPWWFCLRWALGHGITLLAFGCAALLIGAAIPATVSDYAEGAVGLVLIVLGLWVFFDIFRRRLRIGFHSHLNLSRHAHWYDAALPVRSHDHSATLVGALHGTAGFAPILALVPVSSLQSPALGLLYLVAFSAGILVSMLLFGGLLGSAISRLSRFGDALKYMRCVIAGVSVSVGGYLLQGAF